MYSYGSVESADRRHLGCSIHTQRWSSAADMGRDNELLSTMHRRCSAKHQIKRVLIVTRRITNVPKTVASCLQAYVSSMSNLKPRGIETIGSKSIACSMIAKSMHHKGKLGQSFGRC